MSSAQPLSLGCSGGSAAPGRQRDRQVARALADRRRASHRARPEALDRRPLVGVRLADDQIVLEQFVVALGVCHRRLEQLAPVARHLTRGEGEDSACLLHRLAAQMPAHHPRLARRGAHVAGARAHDAAPRAGSFRVFARTDGRFRRGFRRRCGAALCAAAGSLAAAGSSRPLGLFCRRRLLAPQPLWPPRAPSRLRRRSSASAGFLRAGFFGRGRLRRRRFGFRLGFARAAFSSLLCSARGLLGRRARDVLLRSSALIGPSPSRRVRGTPAWARTRRACGRPSTR